MLSAAGVAAAVGLWQSLVSVLRSKLAALGALYAALTSAPAARACKADLQRRNQQHHKVRVSVAKAHGKQGRD
jgi:hypothetical protein